MPSAYLLPGEYEPFGAPSETTAAQVTQASVLIDSYLRRPEGLVYSADSAGNPCFMQSMAPIGPFSIAAGLAPGTNVLATVTGPISTLQPGSVIIAEKATPANLEPLVVSSIVSNQVTFESVTKTHAVGATYHTGLVIFETRQLPSNRPLALLSKNPICRILSMSGRCGFKRRGGGPNSLPYDTGLLASTAMFGGPLPWQTINVAYADFNRETGQVCIPASILMANFTEVRFNYVSGFPSTGLPDAIKLATASIINAQASTPLNGNIKLMKAGDTQMERFIDSVLDSSIRQMLSSYRARTNA